MVDQFVYNWQENITFGTPIKTVIQFHTLPMYKVHFNYRFLLFLLLSIFMNWQKLRHSLTVDIVVLKLSNNSLVSFHVIFVVYWISWFVDGNKNLTYWCSTNKMNLQ
jgi:hypothetical protein